MRLEIYCELFQIAEHRQIRMMLILYSIVSVVGVGGAVVIIISFLCRGFVVYTETS